MCVYPYKNKDAFSRTCWQYSEHNSLPTVTWLRILLQSGTPVIHEFYKSSCLRLRHQYQTFRVTLLMSGATVAPCPQVGFICPLCQPSPRLSRSIWSSSWQSFSSCPCWVTGKYCSFTLSCGPHWSSLLARLILLPRCNQYFWHRFRTVLSPSTWMWCLSWR